MQEFMADLSSVSTMSKQQLATRTMDTAHMSRSYFLLGIAHILHSMRSSFLAQTHNADADVELSKYFTEWFSRSPNSIQLDLYEINTWQQLRTFEFHTGTGLLFQHQERVCFPTVWEGRHLSSWMDQPEDNWSQTLCSAINSSHWIRLKCLMFQWVSHIKTWTDTLPLLTYFSSTNTHQPSETPRPRMRLLSPRIILLLNSSTTMQRPFEAVSTSSLPITTIIQLGQMKLGSRMVIQAAMILSKVYTIRSMASLGAEGIWHTSITLDLIPHSGYIMPW